LETFSFKFVSKVFYTHIYAMTFNKKTEYLKIIGGLFLKFGFKSMGVDDIARELGISKKTLYQEFKDKNDIIDQVVTAMINEEETSTCMVADESDNAIDEIIQLAKMITTKFKDVHPSVIFELQKYYPAIGKKFENHKKENVYSCMHQNLKRGIKEGLYRSNLNIDIIASLFINKIEMIMNRDFVGGEDYSFQQVYLEMMRYHVRGIANEKGREYLKGRINQVKIDL
jgi:AcrR family transcriptional regulator